MIQKMSHLGRVVFKELQSTLRQARRATPFRAWLAIPMKEDRDFNYYVPVVLMITLVVCLQTQRALAQGYGAPLTVQGLDRTVQQSAASRALGGTMFGLTSDVGTMFSNPASLHTLKSIQVSLGGASYSSRSEQTQHYAPLKYYSNFSLLMEGLTVYIPNPDTSLPGVNAGDTVQRPYDTIRPDWSRSKDRTLPVHALLAVPFTAGEAAFAAGLGVVEYADLNNYYQNNNVLDPSILSNRPLPTPRPPNDSIPTLVRWWQNIRSREGSLRGYGAALSASLFDRFSLGVSGMIIKGTTDDFEQRVSRGRMTFYTNFFRLDSVYGRITRTGTSDFSGTEFTISGMYRTPNVTFGFSAKPPTTIARKYTTSVLVDTAGAVASTISGEDKMRLPWRGTLGIAIKPGESLLLGLEYEIRSFASAVYTQANGVLSHPWLSASVFHLGVQYTPVEGLMLRAGLREQAEVFESEGSPIVGEPVSSSVYSAGVGVYLAGVRLNVTYEYQMLKYQDVWGSAVSFNSDKRHTLSADISYEIRSLW